jgi:thiol-disulfide isomerase/thioredoxin
VCVAAARPPGDAGEPATFDLERFRGSVVLLDFWASWCAPCAESFPWMADMARRHGPSGLVVVTVNLDEDRAEAERFLGDTDWPLEVVFDAEGRLAERFALRAMPTSLLWDRDGRLVERREGFRGEQAATYERTLLDALEGRLEPIAGAAAPSTGGRRRGLGVRPWERSRLAAKAMQLDADLLDLELDDHIYFSKEASSGGRSFGGGGCGCN